ncbi:MAG TPA: DUF488 family protein [Steroidobacteraceae bacterium]
MSVRVTAPVRRAAVRRQRLGTTVIKGNGKLKANVKAKGMTKATTAAPGRRAPAEFSSPACLLHEFEGALESAAAPDVRIKRINDKPAPEDGFRTLVDRLWPRGMTRHDAALDAWARELAPSTPLRRWFNHDPDRWIAFRSRYRNELRVHASELEALRRRAGRERVTLLYAARDAKHNNAVVIMGLLRRR